MKPLSTMGHDDGDDDDKDINIHNLDDANSSLGDDYYSDVEQRYPYSLPNGYGSSLRQPTTTTSSEDGSAGTARSGGRLSGTAHYPYQKNQCDDTSNKWNSLSAITKTSIARSGAMDDSDVWKERSENHHLIDARQAGSTSKSEVEASIGSPALLDHSLARDDHHNANSLVSSSVSNSGGCDDDTSDIKSVNSSSGVTSSSTPNTSTLSQKDPPETSPTNTTSSSGTTPPTAGGPLGIAQPLYYQESAPNALFMTASDQKTEIADTDSAVILGDPMTTDAAPLNLMETERLANEPNVSGFHWMGMGGGVPLLVPIQRTLDGSRTYDGSIPTYTNRTDVEDAGATISKDDGSLEIIYPHSHYIANVSGGTDELYASQAIQLAINRGNSMADKAEPSIEDGRSIDDGSTISSSHKLPGFLHFYDHNNRVANEATKSGGGSEWMPPKRPKRLIMFAVAALLVVVLAVIVGATACGLTVCQGKKSTEVLESPKENKEEIDAVPARTPPPSPSTAVPTGRSGLSDGGDGIAWPSLEPLNKATSSPRGDTNADPVEAADPDEAEPTPSPLQPSTTARTSAPQLPTPTQPVGPAGTLDDTTSKPAMSPVDDNESPQGGASDNKISKPTDESPNDDTLMSPSPSPDDTPTNDNETDDSETGDNEDDDAGDDNDDDDPERYDATETPISSPVNTFKPSTIGKIEPLLDPPTGPPEESLTDWPTRRPTGPPDTVETNAPAEPETEEPAEDETTTEPPA